MTTDELTVAPVAGGPPNEEAGTRHLSWLRISVVVVLVVAAVTGTWIGIHNTGARAAAGVPQSWFAPYVDVTATPQYAFEDTSTSAPTGAVLGFVVSAKESACQPSWGSAYSLAQASDQLDLDRRVARLNQLGGAVTVSFGGAANSELSIGCTDVTQLTAAYRSVVDRYSVRAIDFDIEGSVASAPAVATRRAQAIAALTQQEAAAGHPVQVWITLPVGPSGLTSDGRTVFAAMLAAKVELAGVNGMTMDYGIPIPTGSTMSTEGELALTALAQQIHDAYAAAGIALSVDQIWQRVGATPMIGQNDTPGEQFGLADAQELVAFSTLHHLGRISMWSANRDQGCGPNYPDVHVVSDACSGVAQAAGDYAAIFGKVTGGLPAATAGPSSTSSSAATASVAATTAAVADDPGTSPYAIWNVNETYPKDTKIVWHHNVYQAKWYTAGDQPDLPVADSSATPWTLLGPVLPGEHPAPTPTMKAGTYPEWRATTVYVAGSRVLFRGVGFQAKWWTQGEQPGAVPASASEPSPWQLLTGS